MERKFLEGLGLDKDAIDKVLDENSADIGKHKSAAEAAKTQLAELQAQLAEASTQIEAFKGMDIDGIKAAADEWRHKAEQAEKDAAARIAAIQFDSLMDSAITGARGRNSKAIKALLDMETLQSSKNQESDVKAALEALKADSGYLFETDSPPPQFAGPTPGAPSGKPLDQMTYSESLAYLAAHPGAQLE